MGDPKIQGAPILKDTMCSVGTHAFIWAGRGDGPPPETRCSCRTYTWEEWQRLTLEGLDGAMR